MNPIRETLNALREAAPSVGIFFYVNGKIIIDDTPTKDAPDFGDFKSHDTSHDAYWKLLQVFGDVDKNTEYDDNPRGRVVYNKVEDLYYVYVDKCIFKDKTVTLKIASKFNLPNGKYKLAKDDHYVCKKCGGEY